MTSKFLFRVDTVSIQSQNLYSIIRQKKRMVVGYLRVGSTVDYDEAEQEGGKKDSSGEEPRDIRE